MLLIIKESDLTFPLCFWKLCTSYLEKNQKTWELDVSDESIYWIPEINVTLMLTD